MSALRSAVATGGDQARGSERLAYVLYGLHLLLIASLALSNILLGACLLTLPWWLRRSRWGPPSAHRLWLATAAYIVCLLAAILASYEPATSARALSEIFSLATLGLGLLVVRFEKDARRLVDGLILMSVLVAVTGLAQFLWGYGDLDRRIRGPLSHYMTFSGVLLLASLLLLARLAQPGGWKRPLVWLGLVVLNVALFGSLTRGAWVALAVAVGTLVVVRAPRGLLLLPLTALIFVLVAPVPVLHRASSIVDVSDESNYDRLCMARAGLMMVMERPLFGIGPDLVKDRYPLYRHATAPRFTVPHLHNSFLQLAAERGLPALAAYLLMLAASLQRAFRGLRREGGFHGPRADIYLGVILALIGFAVAGLFENNWGDTEVQRIMLFVLVLPFVIGREAEEAAAATVPGGGT